MARSGKVRAMMSNRRKAAIGYATYVVASRAARAVIRSRARTFLAAREQPPPRRRRRVILPLVGGAAAAAVAGAAVVVVRHRGADAGA
jgi:hypothetical protein